MIMISLEFEFVVVAPEQQDGPFKTRPENYLPFATFDRPDSV